MRRNNPNTRDRRAVVWHGWIVGGALLAINAGISTITAPAEAAVSSCETTVTEHLNRLNIDHSDVRKISCLADRRGGRDGGRVVGIMAWVSLQSCTGNLVFDMSRHGQVRQVYGRGGCELDGAVKAR